MSASITGQISTTGTYSTVNTISTGTLTPVTAQRRAITNRSFKNFGYIDTQCAGSDSESIWPSSISAIATGDVLVIVVDFYHGTTDTSLANKAITVTVNAEVINSWGDGVEFSSTAVTTAVVARAAGNEPMQIVGYWYVYTV